MGTEPPSFIFVFSMAGCFITATAELRSVTDAIWPAKPKQFTILSFTENVCQPWIYVGLCGLPYSKLKLTKLKKLRNTQAYYH